jgi:hypothetical protein
MTGRPAAFCFGPGHVVVHGNPAFHASFGPWTIGQPAREILVDLPSLAFEVMDQVFAEGRPLAAWLPGREGDWRLTVAPRIDPETDETYGVTFHLRARSDVPLLAPSNP